MRDEKRGGGGGGGRRDERKEGTSREGRKRKKEGRGTDNIEFLSIASRKVSTGAHSIQRELKSPVNQLAGVRPGPNLYLCDGNTTSVYIHSHYVTL